VENTWHVSILSRRAHGCRLTLPSSGRLTAPLKSNVGRQNREHNHNRPLRPFRAPVQAFVADLPRNAL
jgi:hypothetical protein